MATNTYWKYTNDNSTYDYSGTTVEPYLYPNDSEVKWNRREPTLDEILFDDDETLEKKCRELVIGVPHPGNIVMEDLEGIPGNVIYVDDPQDWLSPSSTWTTSTGYYKNTSK